MKVIIAGSRTISPHLGHESIRAAVHVAKALGWEITEVVSGQACGVDTYGELWAKAHRIPVNLFPADWKPFKPPDHERVDRHAGYKRNERMAEYADALIAITTGSPGTRHMIQVARSKNMPVIVIEIQH